MSAVETLFNIIDSSVLALKKDCDISYLEGLVEVSGNFFEGKILQDGLYSSTYDRMKKEIVKFEGLKKDSETTRRAFQLALLKGMKEGVQANHEMTPDAVAMFMSYLVQKFTGKKEIISVLDPAVGTGNLLTAVLNGRLGNDVKGFGVDADELLVQLAYANANLQENHVELFHSDGLGALYIDPVDAIVSDLPIGYYPNEERAQEFELNTEEGMPYIHYLYIEQCVKHIKEDGYIFLLVPNHLFETEQGKKLHSFIHRTCYIQGLLQLPTTLFKSEQFAKSIFVLQKKGPTAKAPTQVLLAELPQFTNAEAMAKMMMMLEKWFTKEI